MASNERIKVVCQLKCVKFIVLSDFEGSKSGIFLSKGIIFDNIVAMNFGKDVRLLFLSYLCFYSLHEVTLNKYISTKVAVFPILMTYLSISEELTKRGTQTTSR